MSRTILLTGATRGLGLAIARALDAQPDVSLVLAVRDLERARELTAAFRRAPRIVRLDVSSMSDVHAFTRAWREPLHALVSNAGLQITGPVTFTKEGFEETLAVNHLGPTWLALGLLPHLRGGRVVTVGSGTHNPENRTATMFGFRGARYTSVAALARGESDAASDRLRGMDRYATSKLLTMITHAELARRHPGTTFFTFDPGLMPGTGLARTGAWWQRLAWSTVLRWIAPLLPDTSTPARSAAGLVRLLSAPDPVPGEVYDFTGRPSRRVWPASRDPELARRALEETIALLDARWPLDAVTERLHAP